MADKPTMELEEAATHLHRLTSFFNALGSLEAIIATARSVDNIKNLAAERMEAAEAARVKMADAQSKLAAFELAAAKKMKELESLHASAEAHLNKRIAEMEAEFETRKIAQEAENVKMRKAYEETAASFAAEITMLISTRDDMAAQVDKTEAALAALRKKVAALMG